MSTCVWCDESSQTQYIHVNNTQTEIAPHNLCVAGPKVANATSNSRQPPPHLITVYINISCSILLRNK